MRALCQSQCHLAYHTYCKCCLKHYLVKEEVEAAESRMEILAEQHPLKWCMNQIDIMVHDYAIFYYMSKLTTRLDVNTLVTFADQTLASTELCHVTPHLPQPASKLRLCPTLTLSLNSHLIPHVSCQVLTLSLNSIIIPHASC